MEKIKTSYIPVGQTIRINYKSKIIKNNENKKKKGKKWTKIKIYENPNLINNKIYKTSM